MGFFYIYNMKKVINVLDIESSLDGDPNVKIINGKLSVLNIKQHVYNTPLIPNFIINNTEKLKIFNEINKVYGKKDKNLKKYLLLFIFFGVFLVTISPKKTFNFFYLKTKNKYIEDFQDAFNYNIFKIKNKILKRIFFIFYSFFIILSFIKFLMTKNPTNDEWGWEESYNWTAIYDSLVKYGYDSNTTYPIRVGRNLNGSNYLYYAKDGNHRTFLLKQMYPEGKEIEVLFEN